MKPHVANVCWVHNLQNKKINHFYWESKRQQHVSIAKKVEQKTEGNNNIQRDLKVKKKKKETYHVREPLPVLTFWRPKTNKKMGPLINNFFKKRSSIYILNSPNNINKSHILIDIIKIPFNSLKKSFSSIFFLKKIL